MHPRLHLQFFWRAGGHDFAVISPAHPWMGGALSPDLRPWVSRVESAEFLLEGIRARSAKLDRSLLLDALVDRYSAPCLVCRADWPGSASNRGWAIRPR